MRVNLGNKNYWVTFSHFTDYVNSPLSNINGELRQMTKATFTHEDPNSEEFTAMGYAVVHPNDRFCRYTGRKIAFARALQLFPREVRGAAWEQFFATYGKKSE